MPRGYDEAWDQVRSMLSDRALGDQNGTDEIVVEHDGRRLYVLVLPFGPDSAVVQVMAPLVAGVPDTDELCAVVAGAELRFGRLLLFDDGRGGRSVQHVVRFHADQLRPDVLDHVLRSAAATAAVLEPDLETRFGATFTLEGPA